jgi:hypothetical protein
MNINGLPGTTVRALHQRKQVLGRLDAVIAEQDRETSPARIVRTGVAALYVDRLPHYRGAVC